MRSVVLFRYVVYPGLAVILGLAGLMGVEAAESNGAMVDLTLKKALSLAEEHGPAFASLRLAAERDRLEKEAEAAARKPQASVTTALAVGQQDSGVKLQPAHRQTSIQLTWPLPDDWRLKGTLTSPTWPLTDFASLNLSLSRQWPGTTAGASSTAGGMSADDPADIRETVAYRMAMAREERNRVVMDVVTAWYGLRSAAASWLLDRDLLEVAAWEYRAAEERQREGAAALAELLAAQDSLRRATEAERRSFGDLLAAWQRLGSLLGDDSFGGAAGAETNWGDRPVQAELSERVIRWTDDWDWERDRTRLMRELGVDEFPGTAVPIPQSLPAALPELLLDRQSTGLVARSAVDEARRALEATAVSRVVTATAAFDWNVQASLDRRPQSDWQVLLTFTHPLYQPSLAVAADLLQIRLQEAELQLERRREELVRQVVAAWQEVQTAEEVRAGAASALERSRATLTVAQARQEAGLAAWNEVRRAELAVFQAQADLAAAEGQCHSALLRLADALGLTLTPDLELES